ncbi:MAG: hypothetical protein Ct9H300mP27_11440 [Chloroflexota bacterium]|nr:MAG: hypothetical protein Ct9H300mP27_11440 [Chloroflexota bacterium]
MLLETLKSENILGGARGSVIRGDTIKITLGSYVDIQDNCFLHADSDAYYDDYVSLGHGVISHAKQLSLIV